MFCIYTNMSFLPLSFQSFLSIKKNTLGKGGGIKHHCFIPLPTVKALWRKL